MKTSAIIMQTNFVFVSKLPNFWRTFQSLSASLEWLAIITFNFIHHLKTLSLAAVVVVPLITASHLLSRQHFRRNQYLLNEKFKQTIIASLQQSDHPLNARMNTTKCLCYSTSLCA